MRKSLIFLSILIVTFIAFFDAKDRIEELEEVAANTPSQVEMKQMINKPDPQMRNDRDSINPNTDNNPQNLLKKREEDNRFLENSMENVGRRRDTINKRDN